MKKILNYVDKPINIITSDGTISLESDGSIFMRADMSVIESINIDGKEIPIVESNVSIWGLPEERDDTIIIVPSHVYEALAPYRNDIVAVNSVIKSPVDRKVLGCRSIGRRKTVKINNKKITKDDNNIK